MKDDIRFSQYCTRMWLDNCDENKAHGCVTYTLEEYTSKYHNYLTDKFKRDGGIVIDGT